MIRTLAVVTFTLLFATPATAQTTRERERLERELARNRSVLVQLDGAVAPITGQIRIVDSDGIEMDLASGMRRVRFADVSRIYREGDSLANGALIGMGVLGGWCAYICGQGLNSGGRTVLAVLVNGALGAGLGALIDASHTGTTTLYRRRPIVHLRPTASPRAASLNATITW